MIQQIPLILLMAQRKSKIVRKTCVNCGKEYYGPKRSLYCSSLCKKTANQKKQKKYQKNVREGRAKLEAYIYFCEETPQRSYYYKSENLLRQLNYLDYCPDELEMEPENDICLDCPYPKCIKDYYEEEVY